MKKLLTILVITIIVTTSIACRKHDSNKPTTTLTNAIITGVDYRKCACCGGLMITFTEDPIPYSSEFFDIKDLPANSGITEQSTFPMKVKVAYKKLNEPCGNFVSITALYKR